MTNVFKALIGLFLVFLYYIPKLIYQALLVSYAYVFKNEENLTANPIEHIKRAKKLLKKNKNSLLLYAALEVRFGLERMVQRELLFAEKATKKMLKEYDPVKKRKNLTRLDENVDFPHKIYLVNQKTGEKFEWGKYRPMDKNKVSEIKGKLGDLLHPKEGLLLGISNDPWYTSAPSH